jgi:nicotinamide phosphoribosyltransferase
MLHDFGYRGVSSVESAGIQGAGHLINFLGTDTIAAIETARDYYSGDIGQLGFSVPATEHSVMTSFGQSGEQRIVKMLLDAYPTGILSLVIDSYDYKKFVVDTLCNHWNDIQHRNGKLVFRPDSGNANDVVIEVLEAIRKSSLGSRIEINSKGYKELPPYLGVLWGDGLDPKGIMDLLTHMERLGWAAQNIVFGMGGGLLQKINRDTQRFAFKCCAQKRSGKWFDIFKDPIDSTKKSKKGRLSLMKVGDTYGTFPQITEGTVGAITDDKLRVVFENGALYDEVSFKQVRANSWGQDDKRKE